MIFNSTVDMVCTADTQSAEDTVLMIMKRQKQTLAINTMQLVRMSMHSKS